MPRVLMISYAFPPSGGPGVQRTARFACYLPDFGWTPIVWTCDSPPDLPRDDELAAGLPASVQVRRSLNPAWITRLHQIANWLNEPTNGRRFGQQARKAIRWRMRRVVHRLLHLPVPDAAAPWACRSFRSLLELVRDERIECLWSTYSPASNHLIALKLKRKTGLPWIADFRDLWVDDFSYVGRSYSRELRERRLQASVLAMADRVVAATPMQAEVLRAQVGSESSRVITIPNGADSSEFPSCSRDQAREELGLPCDSFILAYVGSLVSSAEPAAIIEGFRLMRTQLGDDAERVSLRIVGTVPAAIKRLIRESGVSPTVTGYVPHSRAILNMLAADLLISGNTAAGRNCNTIVPAKVYEYLAAGVPILHVGTPGGAVDQLLTRCHGGVTRPPSPDPVAREMIRHVEAWKSGNSVRGCERALFAPFERRELTRQLAVVLDEVTGSRPYPCQKLSTRSTSDLLPMISGVR